jgi:hypothetical protein
MDNPNHDTESAEKLKGVKGWLLFLCVALTILGPLYTIWQIILEWKETAPLFQRFPNFYTAVMVETIITVVLTCFGIYAGYALWSVKPNAPQITKNFLWARLIYVLAIPFIIIGIANLPAAINSAITQEGVKQAIRGIIIFAIWFGYLKRSKRVRNTYQIQSEPEVPQTGQKIEPLWK